MAGCGVQLDVPPGLEVSCSSDDDCPSDAHCNPLSHNCDFSVGNAAPVTAVTAVGPASGRAATTVPIVFDAIDINAPPVGSDTVSISIAYSRDGATWCDATIASQTGEVRAETSALTVVWDALADAQRVPAGGPCSLATTAVVTDPADGAAVTTVLAFADNVRVRVTATDTGAPVAHSETISPVFAIGNDAPVLTLLDDASTFRQASPFEYTLGDSSLDESRIEVQFRITGDVQWYAAALRGSTTGVVADGPGAEAPRLLVWNADAPLPQGAAAGGIGKSNADITLRARAVESSLASLSTYGAWSERSVHVANQTPPVIGAIDIAAVENTTATSLVFVSYEIIDAESDDVDVRVELSVSGGAFWQPATAYPMIQHSGVHDLHTKPTAADRHTFVWNVAADIQRPTKDPLLRLTAADSGGTGEPSVVGASFGLGVDPGLTFLYPAVTSTNFAVVDPGRDGTMLATGDFDGNGVIDYAVWAGSNIEVYPGVAGGGLATRYTGGQGSYHSRDIAVADFNHDGRADLIARDQQDPIAVGLGSPAGLSFGPTLTASTTVHAVLAVGDFDGDGDLDLAANGFQNVDIYMGNGAGAFAAPVDFGISGQNIYAMASGDFDHDGYDDLAYAVATGPGIGNVIRLVPLEVRVRFGAPGASPPFRAGYETVVSGTGIDGDGFEFTNAALAAGDVRGDGRAELMFLDLQQTNVGRLRAFSRDPGWTLHGSDISLPPMKGLHFHAGSPGLMLVTSKSVARGYRWDTGADRLSVATPVGLDAAGVNDLTFTDLTGDGQPDIVACTALSITWRPYADTRGVPAGTPGAQNEFDFHMLVPNGNAAAIAADADEDGLADVLAIDGVRNSSHVAAPFAAQSARDVPTLEFAAMGEPVFIVPGGLSIDEASDDGDVGDFNGDGRIDALISSYVFTHELALGNGAPFGFANGVRFNPGAGGGRVVVGDFDADGRDDLVTTDANYAVFYSRIPAVTPWQVVPLTFNNIGAFTAGDVDNDGVDDLVGVGTSITTYFGNAGTTLSAACTIATPAAQTGSAAVIGDVDGDAKNELLVATGGDLYVYDVTRCSYAAQPSSTSNVSYAVMQLVDVDGDGILDVSGHDGARTYRVAAGLEQGGRPNGRFAAPATLFTTGVTSPGGYSWADFNRDTLPDLFVGDGASVNAYVTHRYNRSRPWSVSLSPAAVLGAVPATDRFGEPWRIELAARRTVDRDPGLHAAGDLRSDFHSRLRASGISIAAGATAISFPWSFAGELASDASNATGPRQVHARRTLAGLDVIVSFPIYTAAATDPTKMHVYARLVSDYDALGAGELPTTVDGRTVFRPVESWVEVARDLDGDLTSGSGPRFVFDLPSRTIRVASDALGVLRAYATP